MASKSKRRSYFFLDTYPVFESTPDEAACTAAIRVFWEHVALLGNVVCQRVENNIHLDRSDFLKAVCGTDDILIFANNMLNIFNGDFANANPDNVDLSWAMQQRLALERSKGLLPSKEARELSDIKLYGHGVSTFFTCVENLWDLTNSLHVVVKERFLDNNYIQDIIPRIDWGIFQPICLDVLTNNGYLTVGSEITPLRYNVISMSEDTLHSISSSDPVAPSGTAYHSALVVKFYCKFLLPTIRMFIILKDKPDRIFVSSELIEGEPESPHSTVYLAIVDANNKVIGCGKYYGVRLSRMLEYASLNEWWRYAVLSYECLEQYGRKVERQRQKLEDSSAAGTTAKQSSKSRASRNKFSSLIKYVYRGDPLRTGTKHSSHASPCEHIRKGYVRHYKNGKTVVIKPTVVNKGGRKSVYTMTDPMKMSNDKED